jgi:hypothetical protein
MHLLWFRRNLIRFAMRVLSLLSSSGPALRIGLRSVREFAKKLRAAEMLAVRRGLWFLSGDL